MLFENLIEIALISILGNTFLIYPIINDESTPPLRAIEIDDGSSSIFV